MVARRDARRWVRLGGPASCELVEDVIEVSDGRDDQRGREWRVAAGLVVMFAGVYVATAARHLLGGDAGEFATVAGTGGYAHPPGYPIYSMYLAGAAKLPISTVAHEAAMATALVAAAAVGVLYLALRTWGAGRFGAAFGAVLFGLAPEIWYLHTVPEAFALNHLVVAAIVWLSAPEGPVRGGWRMAALGVAAAVGIAHHHMVVLMLPVGLYGAWRAVEESERSAGGLVAMGLGLAALGLLPYGYLVRVTRAAPEAYHWGEVQTLSDLVDMFLRREYGTFELTDGGERVGSSEQIGRLLAESAADLAWVPVALAAIGAVAGFGGGEDDREAEGGRPAQTALLLAVVLSGPVFVALIGRGASGTDYLHLRKFHAQFELLVAFLAGLGASWLAARVTRRWLLAAVLAAVASTGVARGLPYLEDHRGPTLEQYLRDTLAPLPRGAVLVGDSDHRYFGFQYTRRVLGLREDVVYVDTGLVGNRWYRERIERRLGVEPTVVDETVKLGRMLRAIDEQGAPIFATHLFDSALGDYWQPYPVGTSFRLPGPEATAPGLGEIYRRNRKLLEQARIEPRPEVAETSWNRLVLTHYGLVWRQMAEQLEQAGMARRAEAARGIVGQMAPWLLAE